mgnify:CR=1 FL=1
MRVHRWILAVLVLSFPVCPMVEAQEIKEPVHLRLATQDLERLVYVRG